MNSILQINVKTFTNDMTILYFCKFFNKILCKFRYIQYFILFYSKIFNFLIEKCRKLNDKYIIF